MTNEIRKEVPNPYEPGEDKHEPLAGVRGMDYGGPKPGVIQPIYRADGYLREGGGHAPKGKGPQ